MDAFSKPDAEKSLLGCWLIDEKTTETLLDFSVSDFTVSVHKKLFSVLSSLRMEKTAFDIVAIMSRAADRGYGEEVPICAGECMAYVPSTVNHGIYERMVKECSRRRNLANLGGEFSRAMADPDKEPEEALEKLIQDARKGCSGAELPGLEEVCFSILDDLNDLAKGQTRAIQTGFSRLDHFTGGLFPGELTILGARPSVGKSAFALNLALNVAKQGKRVLIFSLEMSRKNWLKRAVSHDMNVNSLQMRTGGISPEVMSQMAPCIAAICRLPIKIVDHAREIEKISQITRQEVNGGGVDLVIVDYLQLMETAQRMPSRYEAVSKVSRALKEMTLSLDIPVVALAQVKRPENRVVEMPLLSDLRDSGSIEQDADNVMFLHRVESENDRALSGNRLDRYRTIRRNFESGLQYVLLHIAKARDGITGTTDLYFDGSRMDFGEPLEAACGNAAG